MGTFLFKWDHPASDVYVTGTFDDWAKSERLERKEGGRYEKLVQLPRADEKIYYKFVVDDNWTTDHTAPQETDGSGNANNVLIPEHIVKAPAMASDATTGRLSRQDVEPSSDLPGAFPETPFHDAPEFKIDPIPATAGVGNPVSVRPGDALPHPSTFTGNTVHGAVRLDRESYERGEAGAPVLPDVVTPEDEREKRGYGMFGLPGPSTAGIIPESSLPMGIGSATAADRDPGVMIKSSGAGTSTAELAAKVPLEPRAVAETAPDARHAAEAAGEKLTETVAAAGSRIASGLGSVGGAVAGLAAGAADRAGSVAATAADHVREAGSGAGTSSSSSAAQLVGRVPEVVRESQHEAAAPPEASANPEAVREKGAVERELKETVPRELAATGESSVGERVAATADTASSALASARDKTGAALAGATDKASAVLSGTTDKTGSALTGATDRTGNALAGATNKTSAVLADATDKTGSALAGTADKAGAVLSGATDKTGALLADATDKTGSALAGTADKASAVLTSATQMASSAVNAAAAYTAQVAGRAGDSAAEFAKQVIPEPPGVPEVVRESQDEAAVSPEASANPEAVTDKDAVERELRATVPLQPAAAGGSSVGGMVANLAASAATKASAAVNAAAAYTTEAAGGARRALPEPVQRTIDGIYPAASSDDAGAGAHNPATGALPIAATVPDVVQESIVEAHRSPEAAADETAVAEKSAVESELLHTIAPVEGSGEAAPASPPAGRSGTAIARTVPDVVQESIVRAHQSPEAAADETAVAEKSAVESQLLRSVGPEQGTGEAAPSSDAAPTFDAAAATTAPHSAISKSTQSFLFGAPSASASALASAGRSGTVDVPAAPDVVRDAIAAAHRSPEAAGDGTAVAEKSAVESELLSRVGPAPTVSAAAGDAAPVSTMKSTEEPLPDSPASKTNDAHPAPMAPTSGLAMSGLVPAGATPVSVITSPSESSPAASGLDVPAHTPATAMTSAATTTTTTTTREREMSRDISPMTRPAADHPTTADAPAQAKADPARAAAIKATGSSPSSSSAAVERSNSLSSPGTPLKPAAASAASSVQNSPAGLETGADGRKDRRRSGFFGRLKDKMKGKDK